MPDYYVQFHLTVESLTGSLLGGTLKEHSVPPGRHCPQVPLTQQLGMKCPRLWKWESWVSRKDSTCDPAREASSDNFREKEEVNSASDRIHSFVGWLVVRSRPQKSLIENTNFEVSCTVCNCKVCPGKSPARDPPHEVPCTVCSSTACSGKSPARAPPPPRASSRLCSLRSHGASTAWVSGHSTGNWGVISASVTLLRLLCYLVFEPFRVLDWLTDATGSVPRLFINFTVETLFLSLVGMRLGTHLYKTLSGFSSVLTEKKLVAFCIWVLQL